MRSNTAAEDPPQHTTASKQSTHGSTNAASSVQPKHSSTVWPAEVQASTWPHRHRAAPTEYHKCPIQSANPACQLTPKSPPTTQQYADIALKNVHIHTLPYPTSVDQAEDVLPSTHYPPWQENPGWAAAVGAYQYEKDKIFPLAPMGVLAPGTLPLDALRH